MCGIGGIVLFDLNACVDTDELKSINNYQKERGPDDSGVWIKNNVGMAHTRLSIVDTTIAGHQPMANHNMGTVISYNGEIYNYQKLRMELSDCSFNSNTDTEVLLNGFSTWGIKELLRRIDGMFAFCLFDSKKNNVYLARDRFGKKPLYYYIDKNRLTFSSNIGSIVNQPINLTINNDSLDYYLSELSTPQPSTIWNEVQQLEPGTFIRVDLTSKELTIDSFWSLEFHQDDTIDFRNAVEHSETLLIKAIKKRLIGDVEIGTFLSGGLDSGLITSLLAKSSPQRIKTFTVKFLDSDVDESKDASRVAEQYNTNHTEIEVSSDLVSTLPEIVSHFAEPFADPSAIPTFFVCNEISKHVKVALSGDGGDEIFGGYYNYWLAHRSDEFIQFNPSKFWRQLKILSSKLTSRFNNNFENFGIIQAYYNSSSSNKLGRQMGFSDSEKRSLLKSPRSSALYYEKFMEKTWDSSNQLSILKTLMESSLKTRLLSDYLVKVDRMSMMNSLEVRNPLLDTELAEFVSSLPTKVIMDQGRPKAILRELAKKYIDSESSTRPKTGFGVPLTSWINSDLKELVYDRFHSRDFIKLCDVDKNFCINLLNKHSSGKHDTSKKIWILLMLDLWMQSLGK